MTVGDLIKALSELDQTLPVVFDADPIWGNRYMEVGSINPVFVKRTDESNAEYYEQSETHKAGFTPAIEIYA